MADTAVVTGVIGVLGIAVALIVPQQIDQATAERHVSEATKIEATASTQEVVVDGKAEMRQLPAEYKYNPLVYWKGDSIEITVRRVVNDSMLFIGRLVAPSDTTSLLDMSMRMQPCAPDTTIKEADHE